MDGADQGKPPHHQRYKRVEIVYDDARHYVLTTHDKFDIITSDPIHPWVKGAATLYTKEYFELCKRRLNPGGLVTQWVPLYESTFATVKSEVATFFDAFPYGTVWSNDIQGKGYDTVLLGQLEPLRIDVDALEKRLEQSDHAAVAQSLRDVGFSSLTDVLATYGGQGPDLKPWTKDAEINHDSNLRLQYLAGLGLNLYNDPAIYSAMLAYRRYPEEVFVASPARMLALAEGDAPALGFHQPEARARRVSSLAAFGLVGPDRHDCLNPRTVAKHGAVPAHVRRAARRSITRRPSHNILLTATCCVAAEPRFTRSRPTGNWRIACSSKTRPSCWTKSLY